MEKNRVKISLTKEAELLLKDIKKNMHYKISWNWLSEFVNKELIRQFYNKSKIELDLEAIRFEAVKLNEEKGELNARLAYLAEKAKQLREKKK